MSRPASLDRAVQGVLGAPLDRVDGPVKVAGAAAYAYEQQLPGTAYGVVITATIGKGEVTGIDAAAVRDLPGVLAVLVDDPRLPSDSSNGRDLAMRAHHAGVEYHGQALGIVVAESFEAAHEAAAAVRVEYRPGAGHFAGDMDGALDPNSGFLPDITKGDLDTALAGATHVIDASFDTPVHLPAAMEPHATTAVWEGENLTVHASLQSMQGSRDTIAATLGIDREQVRVISSYVGGGFGGKTGTGVETAMAAIAARDLGRPVKVALTRRQTGSLVHHRSNTRQRLRLGCDASGRIVAVAQESAVVQNRWRGFIEPVHFGTIPLYAGEARHLTIGVARADLPPSGAVRAPGEAVGTFALESVVDEMAEQLGMDPIAFRRLNEPDVDPSSGKPFSTRRLRDCYDEGARRFGWSERAATPGARREGEWLIGMGMATAVRGNFNVPAQARVRLSGDGRALVETDLPDIGTGTYTIVAQTAGEMLGLPMRSIDVRVGDSALPPTSGAGGSFGAGSATSAVALACEEIVGTLAERMGADAAEMTLKDGHAIAGNRRVALSELAGDGIEATGKTVPSPEARGHSQASYGSQFAEVAVNAVTGEVRVRRMLGVFDCGRVLNRKTARSQLLGGMIWGIGSALMEEAVADVRTGQFVNPDFAEYHIPTHADSPPIEVHFIEEIDDIAYPTGAKPVGELGISGAGAAITNAIYNACGYRARSWPITLDKVIAGMTV